MLCARKLNYGQNLQTHPTDGYGSFSQCVLSFESFLGYDYKVIPCNWAMHTKERAIVLSLLINPHCSL